MTATSSKFVRDNTAIECAPLVPEIRLHLATEVTPLWQATADSLDDAHIDPPFWAFAWPGGQALARYVLDHPGSVRDKNVLDIASGSGISAIAAALSGARAVTANDIDPMSIASVTLNAQLNDAVVVARRGDLTAESSSGWNVILAGDVFYERAMALKFSTWLTAAARAGKSVLVSDPGRAYLPRQGVEPIASYDVPTSLDLEDREIRKTTIWTFTG